MPERTELQWDYKPDSYFEAPFSRDVPGLYRLDVEQGKVRMTLIDASPSLDATFLEEAERSVRVVFDAMQVVTHQPYELSGPKCHHFTGDGKESVVVYLKGVMAGSAVMRGDLTIKDASGRVVHDSKAERIARQRAFVEAVSKYENDKLLAALRTSYCAAVKDPSDEFVHLYEVRDALARRFGGDHKARRILGIVRGSWSQIGYLAGEARLSQGRHRGDSLGATRPATAEELDEARTLTRSLIEAYIRYLDGKT